ncbi:MAG: hypothetical protein WCD70_09070 [Alphaproteobacteria bacterium]
MSDIDRARAADLEDQKIREYFGQVKSSLFSRPRLPKEAPKDTAQPHVVITLDTKYGPEVIYRVSRLVNDLFFDASAGYLYPIAFGGINNGKQTQIVFSAPEMIGYKGNDMRDAFQEPECLAVLNKFGVTEVAFKQFSEPFVPARREPIRFVFGSKNG